MNLQSSDVFPYSNPPAVNMILGQLFTNAITDPRILWAMTAVAREPFLPEALRGAAYVDEDLATGGGRHLLSPLTFARLLDMASITPQCRALVVGNLSGYAAAVVAMLSHHVVGIELGSASTAEARAHMERLKIGNVDLQSVTSLADGYAMSAPYDVIIICGAVQFVPEALGSQLAIGGRLTTIRNVALRADSPVGLGKGLLVERLDHKLQYREHFDASSAVLPGFMRPAGFAF